MTWALIGASTIAAQYMVGAIRAQPGEQPGAVISHVVSTHADRAAEFARAHAIANAGTDLDAVLGDSSVHAVYISSTNEKHHPQALAAIAAGKHVLCEKPLAMRVEDGVAMARAAEAAGVVLATNHHLRCTATHGAARDLIRAGRIGRVLSMRVFHAVCLPQALHGWRINDAAAGGGVIPDLTVHDADVVRFILGEDPLSVVAQMAQTGLGDGVEDSAMAVWTMPSGAMVMSHDSFTHPFAGAGFEVHGTQGSILAQGVMAQQPLGRVELVNAEGREAVPVVPRDPYAATVAAFENAARGAGAPAASGWDGVKSLALALAVREAARSGIRQVIDYTGMP